MLVDRMKDAAIRSGTSGRLYVFMKTICRSVFPCSAKMLSRGGISVAGKRALTGEIARSGIIDLSIA